MKKFLALVLALGMVLSLAACGSSSDDDTEETTETESEETEEVEEEETEETEEAEEEEEEEEETTEAEETSSEPVTGGSVTFYYPQFFNVFDPSIQPDYDYALWYSTLWCMDYDAGGEQNNTTGINYTEEVGDVAESWEIADDYSSITVTIKQGVTFQVLDDEYDYYGGRELTAEDVAYSYERLLGMVDGLEAVDSSDYGWHADDGSGSLDMVESIEVVDDYTLTFNFNTTTESSLNSFMTLPINLCGAEWDALTEDQQGDWHYACGTGAYILTDYVEDQSMSFVRNENYYGTAYVDEITLVYISDSTNITSQLIAGSLDWVGEKSSTNVLTNDQITELEGYDTLVEYVYNGSAPAGIGLRVTQEPYNNLDFRIALQQLIDFEDIAEYQGLSTDDIVISGLWNVNSEWSATEQIQADLAEEYSYDPESAQAVIESYGYTVDSPLTLTVALDPLADQTLFTYVKSIFATYGIDMELDVYDDVMAQSMVVADETSTEAFNFSAGGLDTLLQAQNMCIPGGFGYGFFYDDEEFPALIEELASATTLDEQAEIAQEADYYFTSQHWVIAIGGVENETEFMASRIQNYDGQKVYGNGNMRVVLRNIWVEE